MIVTRFAPSPTGFLHIGGARTALFNWLFARHHGGKFLLRIEDTDRLRSQDDAVLAIYDGLEWLGMAWDGAVVHQSANAPRHVAVAHQLLRTGAAYRCYATPEEIELARKEAQAEGRFEGFSSKWRTPDTPPPHADAPFTVRLKAPRTGQSVIKDAVQGDVSWQNSTFNDMILLRGDGTPTYMLAVVVDDHDMGVSHVIRGDDHLNNAPRQSLIYDAMGWERPIFAHLPLIHGADGKKFSKRHGALGVEAYRALGYPAEAMCNALARLGWSHGDTEFFTMDEARAWFSLEKIGRGAARIDFAKLAHLSARHIGAMEDEKLLDAFDTYLKANDMPALSAAQRQAVGAALYCLRPKSKTFADLLEQAHFLLRQRPFDRDEKSNTALEGEGRVRLQHAFDALNALVKNAWERPALEEALQAAARERGEKFGQFASVLRAALAGRAVTPSVFDMLILLGREESLARISETISGEK